jgi:hypothetical protein
MLSKLALGRRSEGFFDGQRIFKMVDSVERIFTGRNIAIDISAQEIAASIRALRMQSAALPTLPIVEQANNEVIAETTSDYNSDSQRSQETSSGTKDSSDLAAGGNQDSEVAQPKSTSKIPRKVGASTVSTIPVLNPSIVITAASPKCKSPQSVDNQ